MRFINIQFINIQQRHEEVLVFIGSIYKFVTTTQTHMQDIYTNQTQFCYFSKMLQKCGRLILAYMILAGH